MLIGWPRAYGFQSISRLSGRPIPCMAEKTKASSIRGSFGIGFMDYGREAGGVTNNSIQGS